MARRAVRILGIGLVVFLVGGNLAILCANLLARSAFSQPQAPDLPGVPNLEAVDGQLWRGAAPSRAGYRALAAHGVRTIIDLRAEDDLDIDAGLLRRLDVRRVRIPLRDGQAPVAADVRRFLQVVDNTSKRVYVHCGAGVGRTGTMAASYLVKSGKADPAEALGRNLAIGPPSLEQITFVAELAGPGVARPPMAISAMSRFLDAPRRIWARVGAG